MKKIRKSKILTTQLGRLEKKKQELQRAATSFPGTTGEYYRLSLEERLSSALLMMQHYVDNSGEHDGVNPPKKENSATATLKANKPNTVIDARVAHYSKDGVARLEVWTNIRDTRNKIDTGFMNFGGIQFEQINNEEYVRPSVYNLVDPDNDPWDQHKGRYRQRVKIQNESAIPVIEIVDEAACNLIRGVVSKHQQLGNLATSGNDTTRPAQATLDLDSIPRDTR